jgi:hypothetical protein
MPVAQLDRVFDYGSEDYGFDPYRSRHIYLMLKKKQQ